MRNLKQIYKDAKNRIDGIAAAPGLVIGKVYLFSKETLEINDGSITDIEEALVTFDEAMEKSKKELNKVYSLAKEKMEQNRAAIFEAQLMILEDTILIETIKKRITEEKKYPEYIVNDEISKYQMLMRTAHVGYMKERAFDIDDIKNRIIRNLQKKRWQSKIPENAIVVSDHLTPADAILFSRRKVQGFVVDHGGLTSHAAIISRSLNIPAVLGTHTASSVLKDESTIIIDGFYGHIIYDPTPEQIKFFSEKVERLKTLQESLSELKDKPSITTDQKLINLNANIDVIDELAIAITNDAKGVGLYRSEQLLEELGEFPSEEEQTTIYTKLATTLYPKVITIRAFDIGGDKVKILDFKEPNPFLGLRGVRVLLDNKSLFKTQLRAVLKASINKNVQFMLPMITTINEVIQSKQLLEECKLELKKEKIEFDHNIKLGIMIEVPSAAVMAYHFAAHVDFVSIGTNDLIQYLMAVDRGNDLVSDLYQEFSPCVITTINHIVQEVKRQGKAVTICGEMAADTLAIPLLIGLGIESLSMAPTTIPYAKRIIREIEFKRAKELAEECLLMSTENEVIERIEKFFKEHAIKRTRNII